MPSRQIDKLWIMIMDEDQDIENIEGTWIDDDPLFDSVL